MVWTPFYILWFVLSFAAIARLLTSKREPSSTLSWLFFVTIVPIFGALLFFIFGPLRLERNAIKRKSKILSALPGQAVGDSETTELPTLPRTQNTVFGLAKRISNFELTDGNSVQILADPADALREMEAAIDAAQTYVHLEYYIISSDEVTAQLFESLARARDRGVEVRVLYDSLGSLSLKRIYFRRLMEKGVKISGFLPFSLLPQRFYVNFRNHRKILIVDGKTAFTGGANIGKQYLGRPTESQWRDYTFRVRGPVCLQLEDVFAQDWHFTTEEDLGDDRYYPAAEKPGDAAVQVLESGPDTEFRNLHRALLMAINSAQKRVWLTTPYFVPDSAMMAALELAALRGVDVRLILPAKNDAPVVQWASRSFYESLFAAQIRVFEYEPRVLHAKTILLDDHWTMLGSANMDVRSFRLNFELNLLVYSLDLAKQMEELFLQDITQSKEIEPVAFARRSIGRQILENIARLLTPIL